MPKITFDIPKDQLDKETKVYIDKLEKENNKLKSRIESLKHEIACNKNMVSRASELLHYIRDNYGDYISENDW